MNSSIFDRFIKLFAIPLALCLSLFLSQKMLRGDEPQQPSAKDKAALSWSLESSHKTVSPIDTTIYLRLRVRAKEVAQVKRPLLNLALVLDRSGSMEKENKIEFARRAAHLVADNLTPNDYLAMVAYNDKVHILVPMHPVVNREYLHHRIDELAASGATNLSAGLLEGCAQVSTRLKKPGRHHVILFTDGLANRGVTHTEGLVEMVRRCKERGITFSTVGVGIEYNEKLLARMAQAGGGRYTYTAKADQIPTAFKKELGNLLAVTAQNARLKMELPTGVELQQIFGWEEPLKKAKVDLPLGDLASGDERVLLLKLKVDSQKTGEVIDLQAQLTYDDVSAAHRVKSEQVVHIQKSQTNSEANPPVTSYARLMEGLETIGLAVQGMDLTLAAKAQEMRRREYPQLKKIAWDSRDQDFVNKAYLFNHFALELDDLIARGMLHQHSSARQQLQRDLHYRRYLMQHHRHKH